MNDKIRDMKAIAHFIGMRRGKYEAKFFQKRIKDPHLQDQMFRFSETKPQPSRRSRGREARRIVYVKEHNGNQTEG